MIQMSKSIYYN